MAKTEESVQQLLIDALYSYEDDIDPIEVDTFEGAGVLTMNKGLVLRMGDGTEFQLTIVQSRR